MKKEHLLEIQDEIVKIIFNSVEASRYLGISYSHLSKLTHRREIEFFKPGGKLNYFRKEALDAWMLSNRIAPASEIEQSADEYLMRKKLGGS